MIKVMIADDQKIVRKGIKLMIENDNDIKVVGEVSNGVELLDKVNSGLEIDIILMDIQMPIIDGIEATQLIRKKKKDIKIIFLTTFNDKDYLEKGLKYNINGYLLKNGDIDYMIKKIKDVYRGDLSFDSDVVSNMIDIIKCKKNRVNVSSNKKIFEVLSDREKEITDLIINGYSNKEIARKLYISEGTVKNMVSNIYRKLNIEKRTQLFKFFK